MHTEPIGAAPGAPNSESVGRRKVLAGGLMSAAMWTAPSVLTFDRVAAAVGSGCATMTNLAVAGTAFQPTVGWGGVASRGNDGNVDGHYPNLSTFHSDGPARIGDWWEVDLGAIYDISEVRMWNRTDCCVSRSQNVDVYIDGVFVATDPGITGRPSVVSAGCSGQVVRVVNGNPSSSWFHLAEVEVMGC